MGLRRYMKKYWPLYAMMVLPVIYFIVFKYLPMFGNILAFRRYRPGMSPWGEEWAGLRYFKLFMRDPMFWSAFKNTLVLSLLNLLVNFFLPILFAILLNEVRAKRFKSSCRPSPICPGSSPPWWSSPFWASCSRPAAGW